MKLFLFVFNAKHFIITLLPVFKIEMYYADGNLAVEFVFYHFITTASAFLA